jgi:hypothetical protein
LIGAVLVQGSYVWSRVDTITTEIASAGIAITIIWAMFTKKSFNDAAVRAWVNISLKSLPQFLLTAKMWMEGSAGITATAIILGNVSILMRLIPLSISMKTEGMNRDKTWLFVSDAVNLVSWSTVTIVWFWK